MCHTFILQYFQLLLLIIKKSDAAIWASNRDEVLNRGNGVRNTLRYVIISVKFVCNRLVKSLLHEFVYFWFFYWRLNQLRRLFNHFVCDNLEWALILIHCFENILLYALAWSCIPEEISWILVQNFFRLVFIVAPTNRFIKYLTPRNHTFISTWITLIILIATIFRWRFLAWFDYLSQNPCFFIFTNHFLFFFFFGLLLLIECFVFLGQSNTSWKGFKSLSLVLSKSFSRRTHFILFVWITFAFIRLKSFLHCWLNSLRKFIYTV